MADADVAPTGRYLVSAGKKHSASGLRATISHVGWWIHPGNNALLAERSKFFSSGANLLAGPLFPIVANRHISPRPRLADADRASNNGGVFIAAAAADNLSPEMQKIWGTLVLALIPVSIIVFARLLWGIENQGPKTRPDLFAMPEVLAVCVIFGLVFFPVAISKIVAFFTQEIHGGGTAGKIIHLPDRISHLVRAAYRAVMEQTQLPITVRRLAEGMVTIALPAVGILAIVMMRGGRLRDVFGFGRVSIFRAVGLGGGLAVLAYGLATLAKVIVTQMVGTDEPRQKLVQGFETAITGRDQGVLTAIALSAVVVAPICEEILFRGSLYPVLAKVLGRAPSALITSIVFAMVHDTYSDAPSLAVLALCFTIGYEMSGSLLVPIFMHAAFNGINLAQQWLMTAYGMPG